MFLAKILYKRKNLNSRELIFYYLFVILILLFFTILSGYFYTLGPIYTQDTIAYIKLASDVKNGYFPHSDYLSPGYPVILGFTSKLFSISLATSLLIWTYFFVIISFVLLYQIINLIFSKENFNYLNSFFLTFILTSNWLIVRILITAHADSLFLFFLLLFFYFYYQWLKTKLKKWYIFSALVGCISIWIKLNGLVIIPFLIVSYYIYSNNKKYIYMYMPLIGMSLSFFLFKKINGTVINHLNNGTNLEKIINAIKNTKLLFINLTSSGSTFLSSLFSNSLVKLLPTSIIFFITIISILLFLKYYLFSNNLKKIENTFLLFSFFYWFFLFSLEQYIGYEEINSRTLFPSILSFFLWIICKVKNKKKVLKYLLFLVVSFNLLYSFLFVLNLYKLDYNNCFNSVAYLERRESVVELKKIKTQYNIEDRIYTNQKRALYYTLNFSNINRYPEKKAFYKGKFRELSMLEFDERYNFFCKDFLQNTSALILFDVKKLNYKDSCLITKNAKIYYFKNDILILNIKNSNKYVKTSFKETY